VFDPEVGSLLDKSLTIRLENVDAELALETILRSNGLRLTTPRTTWKRAKDVGEWPSDIVGVTKK
jgi:hypothetical protein